MRASSLISALALGAILAAPAFAATPELTIPQVHDRLVAQGYWNIDKIEREAGGFEIRAHAKNGDRVKLYVDARSGEIVDQRPERRRPRADDARRYGADCNERRCRDDLPPPAAPSGK